MEGSSFEKSAAVPDRFAIALEQKLRLQEGFHGKGAFEHSLAAKYGDDPEVRAVLERVDAMGSES